MSIEDTPEDTGQKPVAVVLEHMIKGFKLTQLIYVAAKLGIADVLKQGPKSCNNLASTIDAHPGALYRVLRALASLVIFAELPDGRFELTPLAELLQSGVPGSLRGAAIMAGEEWYWRAHGALLRAVRTGKPAFNYFYGMGFFEYLNQNATAAAIFNQAMTNFSEQEAAAIIAAYDFSGITTVVDVGGGHGALLAAILKAYPRMHGVLFDLPSVIKDAGRLMEAEGVADRCERIPGDFFQSVPERGDLYMLKSVIHDWEDDDAYALLKNCRKAVPDHGRLLLLERVIPPGNTPSEAKLIDVSMLVIPGGLSARSQNTERY